MYHHFNHEVNALQGLARLRQRALEQGLKIALEPEQAGQLEAFRRAGLIGYDRSTYLRMWKPKKASKEFMKERGCSRVNVAGVLKLTPDGHTVTQMPMDWGKELGKAKVDDEGNTLYKTGKTLPNGLLHEVDLWNRKGLGVAFMPNISTGFNAKQVTHAVGVFVECDGLTLKEQDALLARFVETGLLPTLVYFSGGKSYHFYWMFEKPTERLDLWVGLQERVAHMIGKGADTSLQDPSQLMRLGGYAHVSISNGELKFNPGRVVYESEARYSVDTLDAVLPPLPEEAKQKKRALAPGGEYQPVDVSPWDMRAFAQYLTGAQTDGRPGWTTCQCPVHGAGVGDHSFDSLHINQETGAFICHAGCDSTEVYRVAKEIATNAGHSFKVKKGGKRKARVKGILAEVEKLSTKVDAGEIESLESPGYELTGVTQTLDTVDLKKSPPVYGSGLNFIRSAKGTGKTEDLKARVGQWKLEGKRILLIGSRNILLQGTANEFGLIFHHNVEDGLLSEVNHLAITADSLPKLRPERTYDVVLIDEAEQELEHSLLGSTCKQKRQVVSALQNHFVRQAKQIIVLDADMSDVTKGYWQAQRPEGETATVIENQGKRSGYDTGILVSDKIDCFLGDGSEKNPGRLDSIREGKKVFIFCTSMRRARQLYKTVTEEIGSERVMLVCSRNSAEESQQLFIRHINALVPDYQVVIATSSMGNGVSITVPHFDEVWGVASLGGLPANDITQGLSRVRDNSIPRYIWIDERYGERLKIDDPDVIRHHYLSNADDTCLHLGINPDTHERESRNGPFLDAVVRLKARRNYSINNMIRELTRSVLREGNRITGVSYDQWTYIQDGVEKPARTNYSTKEVLEADVQAVLDARRLNDEEASRYREGIEFLSEQQRVEIERYELQGHYPRLTKKVVESHLKERSGQKPWQKLSTLKTLIEGKSEAIERDERDTWHHGMITDWAHHTAKQQLLNELGFGAIVRNPDALFTSEYILETWDIACQNRERVHRLLNYSITEKAAAKEEKDRHHQADSFFTTILESQLLLRRGKVFSPGPGSEEKQRARFQGFISDLSPETLILGNKSRGGKSNLDNSISFTPPSLTTYFRLSRQSVKTGWAKTLVEAGLATEREVTRMTVETMQEMYMMALPESYQKMAEKIEEESVTPGTWDFAEEVFRYWEAKSKTEAEQEAEAEKAEEVVAQAELSDYWQATHIEGLYRQATIEEARATFEYLYLESADDIVILEGWSEAIPEAVW